MDFSHMNSTALTITAPSVSQEEQRALLKQTSLVSFYEAFAVLPDPRSRHGLRYDLPFLLTCLVAALLCNCNHSEAVGQWCRGQRAILIHLFGQRRYLSPTGALYRWLLPQLSLNALETLLSCWLSATLDLTSSSPI